VYVPDEDKYTVFRSPRRSGYFNNLILADRWLGQLRRAMEASGLWNRTWVILTTDHSWRDSRAYDGQRDLRVPFLIKAPGLSPAEVYSPEMNTVLTDDLILSVLRGEISHQKDLCLWLDEHRIAKTPAHDRETE
jgi:phosphoglycerol transferase MdoB-like AlkP superfamily enzyme